VVEGRDAGFQSEGAFGRRLIGPPRRQRRGGAVTTRFRPSGDSVAASSEGGTILVIELRARVEGPWTLRCAGLGAAVTWTSGFRIGFEHHPVSVQIRRCFGIGIRFGAFCLTATGRHITARRRLVCGRGPRLSRAGCMYRHAQQVSLRRNLWLEAFGFLAALAKHFRVWSRNVPAKLPLGRRVRAAMSCQTSRGQRLQWCSTAVDEGNSSGGMNRAAGKGCEGPEEKGAFGFSFFLGLCRPETQRTSWSDQIAIYLGPRVR